MYIGGVYVKLFVKQPNWGLRNPKEFCTALLEAYEARGRGRVPRSRSGGEGGWGANMHGAGRPGRDRERGRLGLC